MHDLRLTVTAEDIVNGHPRECRYCPLALAACRALGIEPSTGLTVSYYGIYFRDKCTFHTWILPDGARRFMRSYDTEHLEQPVQAPLEFTCQFNGSRSIYPAQ